MIPTAVDSRPTRRIRIHIIHRRRDAEHHHCRVGQAMTNVFRPTTNAHKRAIEEIGELVLRYSYCVDTRRSEEIFDLFTEDGVWDSSDNGHGRPEGREAIRRFFGGGKSVVNMAHHLVLSPLITELSDDEA